MFERCPTRISLRCPAVTIFQIPVCAANRAEAFAIFTTNSSQRNGQKHLLSHYLIDIDCFAIKDRKSQVFILERGCGKRLVVLNRDIPEVQFGFDWYLNSSQAAIAINLRNGR